MKTKPIIIAAAGFIILASAVFFILYGKSANKGSDEAGVRQFLSSFTNYAAAGQTDSLLNCFEADNQKNEGVKRLINLLAGKTGGGGKVAPLAKINFDLDESTVETLADGTISARIPAFFSHDKLETKFSTLILKISKSENGGYKIIQADARQFFTDFVAYENFVRSKTLRDEDIYDPLTLAAFATASKLTVGFDSVIWFSHIQDKTYYYVVNGKWELYSLNPEIDPSRKTSYKMGLIGPDLRPIVPTEFDLIHHIGGTFPDMIEVEKKQKKGFYDISGKEVLPVIYDQIFPVSGEGDNIAALRIGDDLFWLKSDYTVSDKTDIRMADILPKLSKTGSFSMKNGDYQSLTEFNSREEHNSIYLPPSYMVDLNLLPVYKTFKNPMRRNVEYGDASENYIVNKSTIENKANTYEGEGWLQTLFYTVRDYYLGGRSEFYDRKNLVIVDNKRNRIYSTDLGTDYSPDGSQSLDGPCDISSITALNDSLFEVKVGSVLYLELYDTTQVVSAGPYYHYLTIKGNKLVESNTRRNFGFTKFVKMDDNYLNGCYMVDKNINGHISTKRIDYVTPEMLRYIKNEIYADYGYKFEDKRWENVFMVNDMYNYNKDGEIEYAKSISDSLTAIDKYNINFIDQKLKTKKTTTLAAQ
jgi:hypothetical protein